MDPLARPLSLGGHVLRNRVVATAHGTAAVVEGMPLDTDVAYWGRLARGGPGLVVAGGISVAPASTLRGRFLGEAWHEHAVQGYAAKAAAIVDGGAVGLAQLCHLGRETLGAPTFLPFEAPSEVRSPREPAAARVLSAEDCAAVAASFVTSACRMVDAGFAGVELHAAHGYLLAQFLNPAVNLRADRYGADPVGRARLLLEVVEGVRRARPDAVVAVRLSVEDDADGLDLTAVADVVRLVQERAPVDLVDLTVGSRLTYVPDMATTRPALAAAEAADRLRSLREDLDVPLLLCSAFRDRADLEAVVVEGRADLVGMARPHIADPDLTLKLLAHRDDEVRPCVGCNEDCRAFDPVGLCVVNPDLAPPGERTRPAAPLLLHHAPPPDAGPVTVVGGGPAGLETALTVATRQPGRRVVLHERSDRLGGQLLAAGASGTRPGWARLVDYYTAALARAGVEVRCGSEVEPDDGDGARAGTLVWATGAVEQPPAVAAGSVRAGDFLLTGSLAPTHPLVVDDGFGWWPCVSAVEVALARGAASVTVVTPGTAFAASIPADSRTQLLRRLRGRAVEVLTLAEVTARDRRAVQVRTNGADRVREVAADLVVHVGERRARPVPPSATWAVGDCVAPRRVAHAIAEGRELGTRLAAAHDTAPAR